MFAITGTWQKGGKTFASVVGLSARLLNSGKMLVSNGNKRGSLIVFEGCDRSGKTTQVSKLVDVLNKDGITCKMWRFPDRTTAIGQVISDYLGRKCELDDHAVHLLFTANRWEAVPEMKRLLSEGTHLIVDRYSYSGVAFSAAKPGMDLSWCHRPEVGLPKPDAVFFLDLSVAAAEKRGAFGDERYEQTDFQKRVAKHYEILKEDNWQMIDADKTVEDLHTELLSKVKEVIDSPRDEELGQLWTDREIAVPLSKKPRLMEDARQCENGLATNGKSDTGVTTNGTTKEVH